MTIPTANPLSDDADRPVWPAIKRGMARKCPNCGEKTLFGGYTRISDSCAVCGLDFTGHRADDAPPYVTMLIVGHALAIPMVESVRHFDMPLGLQLVLWLSIATAMTLYLLPVSKGGLIALQWANRMHGFGDGDDDTVSDVTIPR